jgi:hypothetical protein
MPVIAGCEFPVQEMPTYDWFFLVFPIFCCTTRLMSMIRIASRPSSVLDQVCARMTAAKLPVGLERREQAGQALIMSTEKVTKQLPWDLPISRRDMTQHQPFSRRSWPGKCKSENLLKIEVDLSISFRAVPMQPGLNIHIPSFTIGNLRCGRAKRRARALARNFVGWNGMMCTRTRRAWTY